MSPISLVLVIAVFWPIAPAAAADQAKRDTRTWYQAYDQAKKEIAAQEWTSALASLSWSNATFRFPFSAST